MMPVIIYIITTRVIEVVVAVLFVSIEGWRGQDISFEYLGVHMPRLRFRPVLLGGTELNRRCLKWIMFVFG